VRVLIADDQELVRSGLRMILDAQPGIEVVAEAADGAEAVALARSIRPDVCLLDIRMPVMDGLEATRELAGPDVAEPIPVVVVTTFDLDEYVYGALRAGARGFLLKNAGATLLAEAVHAAARGDALIDPNVTVRLIEAFAGSGARSGSGSARAGGAGASDSRRRGGAGASGDLAAAPATPSTPLTDREEDVLAAVARGLGNDEIGRELHISLSTVKTHIASLMTKLAVRNRVELAIWAHERARRGSGAASR